MPFPAKCALPWPSSGALSVTEFTEPPTSSASGFNWIFGVCRRIKQISGRCYCTAMLWANHMAIIISFPRSRVGTHMAGSILMRSTDDRQVGIPTLERGNEKITIPDYPR
jgi:hypothetical protein